MLAHEVKLLVNLAPHNSKTELDGTTDRAADTTPHTMLPVVELGNLANSSYGGNANNRA